jgi:hypothetical protein
MGMAAVFPVRAASLESGRPVRKAPFFHDFQGFMERLCVREPGALQKPPSSKGLT